MKRSSRSAQDFRKLLVDVKQWNGLVELTSERLPEITESRRRRNPIVSGEGYKVPKQCRDPYLVSAWVFHETGVVPRKI